MRSHRLARFVAILILLAALLYFLVGVIGAIFIERGAFSTGWGPGWRGWLTIPLLVSTFLSAASLLLFGAVLFFLTKIDANLFAARKQRAKAPKPAEEEVSVVAPGVEPLAAAGAAVAAVVQGESPKADLGTPQVELPEVELPQVEVEAPKVELGAVLPEVELEGPKVELPEVELPQVKVETQRTDEVALLRAQLAAMQARLAELEAPAVPESQVARLSARAELPDVELPQVEAGVSGKLPGADEAARIAAEMAALKPIRRRTEPVADAPPADTQVTRLSAAAPEDDLEAIAGIGPTYARRLRNLGITTFAALAAASDETLEQVARGLASRVAREDWRGQAEQLSQQG